MPNSLKIVPIAPLILGLAGLIPFLWGSLTYMNRDLALWGAEVLGPRFVGTNIHLFYGYVILSFMSGVLWGFSTKAEGSKAAIGYTLSTVPALWAFLMNSGGSVNAGENLFFGFIGLLFLDYIFFKWGLAPRWWMHLRLFLTVVVVICLAIGVVC